MTPASVGRRIAPCAAAGLVLLTLGEVPAATGPPAVATPLPAQGAATFRPVISEARGLSDFDLDGNGGWRVSGPSLVLEKAGVPVGPIRRPAAIAILKGAPIGSVMFTVDVKSTAPADLDVRDVVIIAGYQSPTRFYYAHISRKTDDVHNGIFLVNDADRKRLDAPSKRAPLTDREWHTVRLERDVISGHIRVFFDADPAPFLVATDRTLLSGRVGVGSFDETAEFKALTIVGPTD
jgi:hypothetical protein